MAQRLTKGQGAPPRPLTVPTLLTQSNRSAGRDRVRRAPKCTAKPERLEAPSGCRDCGVVLEDRTRQYCDACVPEYREAQSSSFSDAGRAKLKELRAAGIDPSQTGEAAEKRRSTMRQRRREEAEWDTAHSGVDRDESAFKSEVLPSLQGLSLSTISAATGLSQQYCSLIRRGLKVPHPRHWTSFKNLAEEQVH